MIVLGLPAEITGSALMESIASPVSAVKVSPDSSAKKIIAATQLFVSMGGRAAMGNATAPLDGLVTTVAKM